MCIVHLLNRIRENPNAELDIPSVVDYYARDGRDLDAVAQLEGLTDDRSNGIWRRKTISMVQHENLSLVNARYFRDSYNELVELRRSPGL